MSDIDISVVIPVENGEKYLDTALRAVFSQKTDFRFEVIVIDSGSGDAAPDIIKNYPACRLYRIEKEDFNHGLTRNFGVSQAAGRYIILMTQDAIPFDRRWMGKLVDNIERDGRVAGVYSRQVPHENSSLFTQIRTNRFFASGEGKRISYIDDMEGYDRLSPGKKRLLCNFDNVSSCIRKSVWENFKFPETEFGEDIEWAKRVLEAGYKIIYEPDSKVYHSHDYSITGWYKRNRVDYNKLCRVFNLKEINNAYKLLLSFFVHSARYFYDLAMCGKYKKSFKAVILCAFLIPFYSFAGALGQYMGARD
jgi:rhamnosyltransferase